MQALIRQHGGRRLSVPLNPDAAVNFSALDRDTIERLCEELGGQCVTIPNGSNAQAGEVKLAEVINLTARGLKAWQIARKLGCSTRTVKLRRRMGREAGALALPTGLE